jgi:hypothetical protein
MSRADLIIKGVVLVVLEDRLRSQCEAFTTRRRGIEDLSGGIRNDVRLAVLIIGIRR